jgi:hypothetical protein
VVASINRLGLDGGVLANNYPELAGRCMFFHRPDSPSGDLIYAVDGDCWMTGVRKPKSREAFDLNMNDAETLVSIARLLENERINRIRAELRSRIGTALRIPKAKHSALECLENQQVFITFKPGSAHLRGSLTRENLRPLLRQALVAGCAAVETYVADRTMELLSPVLRAKEKPLRLLEMTMTVQQYLRVQSYQRQNWGYVTLSKIRCS